MNAIKRTVLGKHIPPDDIAELYQRVYDLNWRIFTWFIGIIITVMIPFFAIYISDHISIKEVKEKQKEQITTWNWDNLVNCVLYHVTEEHHFDHQPYYMDWLKAQSKKSVTRGPENDQNFEKK